MLKNKKTLLIAGVVCLLVCLGVVLAMFGIGGDSTGATLPVSGETATYNIEVKSASGVALTQVGLFIYEDSTCNELVAVLKTDENGKAAFTDTARDTYVAVLDKIPTGYEAEPYYPITGELTEIILKTGQMSDVDVETLTYKLGDAVMDFSVIGPDGTEYTLSSLFSGKRAVVLNFFYNGCQPCMLEFPFLQEAYAEYSDKIAVLAMNPVDGDDASVAKLQKDMGITFPMVKCGPEWESIMQISAYPTTVIIDRFGNICLIHTGSVTSAKTFKDAFAYFTADDYKQKMIEAIGDLEIEEPEGTEENPTDVGGTTAFEVTVEPGQVVYYDLWKVIDLYLTIRSENVYIIYNGKTYYPEKGVVSVKVCVPDTYSPATVGIGNSGTKTETFKATLVIPGGTFNNPYQLAMGEFDVITEKGNDKGVCYSYTPTEDGTLTLQCISAPNGVKYTYSLFNTVTSAMRNLEEDAATDESGAVSVSVLAKKGQLIQITIGALPDDTNSYPAATFRFKATFTGHEIQEAEKIPMTDYTVTVVDGEGNPMPNISVVVMVGEEKKAFGTDREGVANFALPTGSYQASFYVPDGYTAEKTAFELTEAAPSVKLTVNAIKKADYTVKVQGPTGEAIENVFVRIADNAWQRTDAGGVVSLLLEKGNYAVTIMVPTGYSGDTAYAFPEGKEELVITLNYPLGTQGNPYQADAYPYVTEKLSKDQETYIDFHYSDEIAGLCIYNEDAYIRYKETTYGADNAGKVYIPLAEIDAESPISLVIGNSGTARTSFTVEAEYALGTEQNPEMLQSVDSIAVNVPAGSKNGYHYAWEAPNKGTLTLNCPAVSGVDYDVIVTEMSTGNSMKLSDSENGSVSVAVIGNSMTKQVLIQVLPAADAQGNRPALETALTGTFVQPVGAFDNPKPITAISQIAVDIPANEENGYCYSWTANKTGMVSFVCPTVPGVDYDVMLMNLETNATAWLSNTELGFVAMSVESGDVIKIHVTACADDDWNFPALQTTITGGYGELGSLRNPDTMSLGKMWQQKLDAGDEDGYAFAYTAEEDGVLTVQLKQKPAKPYEVRLINGLDVSMMSESDVDREVSIVAYEGETVLVHFYALLDEATGTYPTITGRLYATFTPGVPETEPGEEEPSDPIPEPTPEPTPAPSVPSGPAEGEYTYTVTVTDIFGGGQSNVQVIFMQSGAPVGMATTDANGVAYYYTEALTDYTVELFFSDGRDYYYDKATAVLTADNRELSVKLYNNVVETDYQEIYILEGQPAYTLYTGATRVQIGTGKPNFSAENGDCCFFVFTPQTDGTYQITANNPNVELSFWGATTFINKQYTSKDSDRNGAITESISGSSVKNTTYVIGVKVDGSVTDVVLNVARIGDPAFSIADQPWTAWESGLTHTDAWISEVGMTPVGQGTILSYELNKTVTNMDYKAASGTYDLYYDAANGYYRLYEGGPIILVNLNAKGNFVSLYERINGNGQYGGSSVTEYVYDSNGKFVRKEKYDDYLHKCFACVYLDSNSEQGYHPLTKDLMYVLQNGFNDWWDPDSANYLEGFADANKEYAWMFPCCYVAN